MGSNSDSWISCCRKPWITVDGFLRALHSVNVFFWMIVVTFFGFARWSGSHLFVSSSWGKMKKNPAMVVNRSRSLVGKCHLLQFVVFIVSCRIGEASHPGPPGGSGEFSWSLGICNPSGLNDKVDQVAFLDGDVWLMSETHLTGPGVVRFRKGLAHLRSPFTSIVPGSPCRSRGMSEVGHYSGVLAVSKLPARPLPQQFDAQLFESARIQGVGFQVSSWWCQAGLLYRYPDSVQHANRTFQTSCLLDELVQRIGNQAVGPRLIAGDFNHGPDDLEPLKDLYQLGFREIQEIGLHRFSRHIQPTCGGCKNIDQMWLSPELQALLIDYQVRFDDWAGHASILCQFAMQNSPLVQYHWFMPQPISWPETWPQSDLDIDWSKGSTEQYAMLWYKLELTAQTSAQMQGNHVDPKSFGRGQTLSSTTRWSKCVPPKKGREQDINPAFFGDSLKHCQWIKQMRRLQNLLRMRQSHSDHPLHSLKCVELWAAIRKAPGFTPNFCQWWQTHSKSAFVHLTCCIPIVAELQDLHDQFRSSLQAFEAHLCWSRVQKAKQARLDDPNIIFRDCAEEAPTKVDTLVISRTAEVVQVQPEAGILHLSDNVQFVDDQPLAIRGTPVGVLLSEADQVWVSDSNNAQPGDVIRQDRVICTDHDIIAEFHRVWTPRWQKQTHVLDSQWQQIMEFTSSRFHPIEWNFPAWTDERVVRSLHKKKRRAATGPDGVSRIDLIKVLDSFPRPFTDLYAEIENGMQWPQQLTRGFVASLFKNKGDGGVDSYRPITVFPIIYRMWSTCRAADSLSSVLPFLPKSVAGGVPGRQAKSVWIEVAQIIENAYLQDDPLQGMVLDICRAFNGLPRLPIWHFLKVLSFPADILMAWATFVSTQCRMFKIRTSVGSPLGSNVGFPEGCALSVFAMTLIDWLLDAWIDMATHGNHCLYAYVDDWHITFTSLIGQQKVWDAVTLFAQSLDISIDEAKSYLWATHPQDRKDLRQSSLDVMLFAKNLGAHHNFSRKSGNVILIQRIKALHRLWPKLKNSQAPLRQKLRTVLQLAWPKAFYGISVAKVGNCHYKVLRTGATRSLKGARIGSNPMLHLSHMGPFLDPEAFAILQTCRELREVGNTQQLQYLLGVLVQCPDEIPHNGPTWILAERLRRLGWVIKPNGNVQDCLGEFNLFAVHWHEVQRRIVIAWPHVMACEVAHRSSFADLQRADIACVGYLLKQFGSADQVYIACALNGALYTDIGKTKSNRGRHSVCQHCGAEDSFFHRLWECGAFESARAQFPWKALLSQLPACLVSHGWPIFPAEWYDLARYFVQMPHIQVSSLPECIRQCETLDLFTDGACAHPKDPILRYAAYAVTAATGGPGSLEHCVVGGGPLPGLHQTAYRAELQAMVRAIQISSQVSGKVRIWTDNQTVWYKTNRLLQGALVKPNASHADLLMDIQQFINDTSLSERVEVFKVTSHCDPLVARDDAESWIFWHNQLVDAAAEGFNHRRPMAFWHMQSALQFSRQLVKDIWTVIVSVGRLQSQCSLEKPSQEGAEVPQGSSPDEPYPLPCVGRPQIPGAMIRLYGRQNVDEVLHWWQNVGEAALRRAGPLRWVSGYQLYLDFWLTTGYEGLISTRHGRWFSSPQEVPHLRLNSANRTTMFLRVWNAMMKSRKQHIPRRLMRPASAIIACWVMTYRLPWPKERLEALDRKLLQFFKRQVAKGVDLTLLGTLPRTEEDISVFR